MAGSPARSSLRRWLPLVMLLAAAMPAVSAADEPDVTISAVADPSRRTAQERPFVFSTDPSTPSAGVISGGYAFGVGSGISADRPLPVNMASASGSSTVALTLGVTDRIAPFVNATFADVGTSSPANSYAAGVTWQLTNPVALFRVSASAAGIHEGSSGANGLSVFLAASQDLGALRLVANARADKVFATGRDAADYIVTLGTTWRLGEIVRLGAEYVGQDLEETFTAEAEGGARHGMGPTLALDLDGGRYQLAVGSAFGLTARSPRAIARGTLYFSF